LHYKRPSVWQLNFCLKPFSREDDVVCSLGDAALRELPGRKEKRARLLDCSALSYISILCPQAPIRNTLSNFCYIYANVCWKSREACFTHKIFMELLIVAAASTSTVWNDLNTILGPALHIPSL